MLHSLCACETMQARRVSCRGQFELASPKVPHRTCFVLRARVTGRDRPCAPRLGPGIAAGSPPASFRIEGPGACTCADREGDLEKRLREMERANRELAERLDAAQSRHDQQMKALLEQLSKLSKKVEAGGSGSGGAVRDRAGAGRAAVPAPTRTPTRAEGDRAGAVPGRPGPGIRPSPGTGSRARAPRRSTR